MSVLSRDRNSACRTHAQDTYRGMRCLVLENELARISFFVDKGTKIFECLNKPMDVDFLYLNNQGDVRGGCRKLASLEVCGAQLMG